MTDVCIHTVQAIKRALILKVDLKKNFLYPIDCETECTYSRSLYFSIQKKKKEKKEPE